MEQYIEFVKTHLPDIISYAMIAVVALYQIIERLKSVKTNQLAKTFFTEKTNTVNAAYAALTAENAELKRQTAEQVAALTAENTAIKDRLQKAEQVILIMCSLPKDDGGRDTTTTEHQTKEGA